MAGSSPLTPEFPELTGRSLSVISIIRLRNASKVQLEPLAMNNRAIGVLEPSISMIGTQERQQGAI